MKTDAERIERLEYVTDHHLAVASRIMATVPYMRPEERELMTRQVASLLAKEFPEAVVWEGT